MCGLQSRGLQSRRAACKAVCLLEKATHRGQGEAMTYLVVLYTVLNVDKTDDFELLGQLDSPVPDDFQTLCWDGLWGDAAC